MITVLKSKQHYTPKNGDILQAEEYINRKATLVDVQGKLAFLNFVGNPWAALNLLGISADDLKKETRYTCPYTDNKYHWFIPFALVLKGDVECYQKDEGFREHYKMIFDWDWTKWALKDEISGLEKTVQDGNDGWDNAKPCLSSIQHSIMGHGYTVGTLPTDGSRSRILVAVDLSNGDSLLGYVWEWYNK